MQNLKLFKYIKRQRIALMVALLVVSISVGGGLYYGHRQNQLSWQREQAAIGAAKEEERLTRQETAKSIDGSASALEQKASTATAQPTVPKTSQHPGPVLVDNKKKNIKLIQGGSLIPDQGTITHYKGQSYPGVVFRTNDGTAVPFPTKPLSDSRPYGIVSLSGIPNERRSTWTVHIDTSGMPVGTFKAEALSTVNDGQGNTVQYSGSVMVTIVEPSI